MTNKPFVFFIHIPKTAGSSFMDLMMRRCGKRFCGVYSNLHNEQPFTFQQLEEFVTDYGDVYDCLASHRLSANFPAKVGERACLGVSFVRDPFDLFVSHYYYHRFHSAGFAEARRLDLEAYFDFAVVQGNHPHYSNWQSHVLRGCKGDKEELDFNTLKERIARDELYVFPTANFDTSCLVLEALHPAAFRGVWYKRKNVSKKDQEVPKGLRERFAERSQEDYELLNLARAQFERLSKKAFPEEGDEAKALVAFQARNRRKSLLGLPRAAFRRVLLKMLDVV